MTQIRLRLAVRRNGLPKTNVVWSISLENEPTVAKLLEQVNEIIPLEAEDWGLEDYAVELRSSDGSSFECLHFQPVRTVLKEDDQVFIRPLFTDDLRRRRVSGRHQISSDGKHLIDGVAFGRPLLKTPRGRPPLNIPPRKRRRITYDDEEPEDSEQQENEEDGDYYEQDQHSPMLLLTNGEEEEGRCRTVRIQTDFDDMDADDRAEDRAEDEDQYLQGHDEPQDNSDASEPEEDVENDDDDMEDEMDEDEDLEQELQDLRNYNKVLDEDEIEPEEDKPTATTSRAPSLTLEALDKLSALRAAFPSAPHSVREQVLETVNGDIKKAYFTLVEGFTSEIPLTDCLAWPNKATEKKKDLPNGGVSELDHSCTTQNKKATLVPPLFGATGEEEEDDDQDDISPFIRRFDRQGLPPGSITSGRGLEAMASFASSKLSGVSEATLARLVSNTKLNGEAANIDDDDDSTSSSGTSSSSESDSDDDESDSSDDSNNDSSSDSDGDGNAAEARTSDHPASEDTHEQDDDESSDDDSGPEEESAKNKAALSNKKSTNTADSSAETSSSEELDSDDTSSSEESSEDDSSGDESSLESESEEGTIPNTQDIVSGTPATETLVEKATSQSLSISASQPTVPPGSGKTSTQKRNARRRAFLKAKRDALENQTPGATLGTPAAASTTHSDEKVLVDADLSIFEAKRKALLDAISDAEVDPSSEPDVTIQSVTSQRSQKRKRDELDSPEVGEKTTNETPVSDPQESPTAAQKRRRIDLGAGRRMLFGALGLRNPKNKDDEEKIRSNLMKDVRAPANARLEEEAAKTKASEPKEGDADKPEPVEEDPNAWRDRITYRAVECCHEGVELSEPPFPFVQRWDPQQQGSWFKKRGKGGGRGKRAERNQLHFYQQPGGSVKGKKRKYGDSVDWDEAGYDDTFNSAADTTNGADIQLNYDDPAEPPAGENTPFSDLNDLPSLPDDLSSLPPLRPGEVKTSMVITWKQFILSKATNWQPQMSNLTGVVVRVDDDATGLQVLLARRDRNLDRNEKEYDDVTGQRIYGRFEAPEVDVENEEDEAEAQGYRTLNFSDMVEPKILQQPILTGEPNEEPTVPSIEGDCEATKPDKNTDTKETSFASFEDEPMDVDTTVDAGPAPVTSEPAVAGHCETEKPIASSKSTEGQPEQGKGQESPGAAMESLSQVSSPSRQLLNESIAHGIQDASVVAEDAADLSANDDKPVDNYVSVDNDVSADNDVSVDNDVSAVSEVAPESIVSDSNPSHKDMTTPVFNGDADIITGTPKVTYLKLDVPPSSASSVRSGRQPDFSMDMDVTEPDSFRRTTEEAEESVNDQAGEESAVLGEPFEADEEEQKSPTPTPARPLRVVDSPNQKVKGSPSLKIKESPKPKKTTSEAETPTPSTPCSISSLNTVWCTAATSHNTQSPSKSQASAAKNARNPRASQAKDAEYEALVRQLDDLSEDDVEDASKISDSFKLPKREHGESDVLDDDFNDSPKSDRFSSLPPRASRPMARISPPPTARSRKKTSQVSPPRQEAKTRRTTRSTSSQFSVSQSEIILISSDSDEVPYAENYADEDVDGTYDPAKRSSSRPHSSGWISKKCRGRPSRVASQRSSQAPPKATKTSLSQQDSAVAVLMKRLGRG